ARSRRHRRGPQSRSPRGRTAAGTGTGSIEFTWLPTGARACRQFRQGDRARGIMGGDRRHRAARGAAPGQRPATPAPRAGANGGAVRSSGGSPAATHGSLAAGGAGRRPGGGGGSRAGGAFKNPVVLVGAGRGKEE